MTHFEGKLRVCVCLCTMCSFNKVPHPYAMGMEKLKERWISRRISKTAWVLKTAWVFFIGTTVVGTPTTSSDDLILLKTRKNLKLMAVQKHVLEESQLSISRHDSTYTVFGTLLKAYMTHRDARNELYPKHPQSPLPKCNSTYNHSQIVCGAWWGVYIETDNVSDVRVWYRSDR